MFNIFIICSIMIICNRALSDTIFEIDSAIIVHTPKNTIYDQSGIMNTLSKHNKTYYYLTNNKIITEDVKTLTSDTSIYNFSNEIYRMAILKNGIIKECVYGCSFYQAKVTEKEIEIKTVGNVLRLQYNIVGKILTIFYKEKYPVFEDSIYLYFHKVDNDNYPEKCKKSRDVQLLPDIHVSR